VWIAVSLAELILAAVFVVSGAAKLFDRVGTRRAVEELGGPVSLAPAIAVALPVIELGIGLALIPALFARWGAVSALALLLALGGVVARSLARGAAPECNCFGGLSKATIGPQTLVRNAALCGLAALAVLGGGSTQPGALGWIEHLPAHRGGIDVVVVGMGLVIACLAWVCWQLLRQNGRLLLRLDLNEGELRQSGADPDLDALLPPLRPGVGAPDLVGENLEGDPVSLESLLNGGRPVTLLFADSRCEACHPALAAAAETEEERSGAGGLVLVGRGDRDTISKRATEFGLRQVIHDSDGELFRAFRVRGTPAALRIDTDGRLATETAVGADAARELVAATASVTRPEVPAV
jgi:uncharacterized membrane protein YphA (DoxX/SURF4 family)